MNVWIPKEEGETEPKPESVIWGRKKKKTEEDDSSAATGAVIKHLPAVC